MDLRTPAVALAALLAACGGETVGLDGGPAEVDAGPAHRDAGPADGEAPDLGLADAGQQLRTLTVRGGFGGGRFAPGTPIEVWADLPPATTSQFDGWAGDADALGLDESWHQRFEMPDRDVNLEARVSAVNPSFETRTYLGASDRAKTAQALLPDNPAGLALFLHGTGGSSSIIRRVEGSAFAIALARRGWAVISPEAEEVVAGDLDGNGKIRWNPAARVDNLDFGSLDTLVATLIAEGVVGADAPRVVVGMSNGGAMSVSLGAVAARPQLAAAFENLRFDAAVSYCASGRAEAAQITETPTAWFMCARDTNESVGERGNAQAMQQSAALTARGLRTQFDAHPPSAVFDARFTRIPGIDPAASAAMANELRDLGATDAQGILQMTPTEIITEIMRDPARAPTLARPPRGTSGAVRAQIQVMYADHSFFSDWAARTHAFFVGG